MLLALYLLPALALGAPTSEASTCKALSRITDQFDTQLASPIATIGFTPAVGKYLTYTNFDVLTAVAGINNVPPPSTPNWIGNRGNNNGRFVVNPNGDANAFRLYSLRYACVLTTQEASVKVIPSCRFSVICSVRGGGDQVEQNFSFTPDSTVASSFKSGTFTDAFHQSLTSCSVTVIDYTLPLGVTVPGSTAVALLLDNVDNQGLAC